MLRRCAPWFFFAAAFVALQAAWQQVATRPVGDRIIEQLALRPAAIVVDWLTPTAAITAQGRALVTLGSQMHVLPGCDGADLAILACAAALAAPLALRARLVGVFAGAALAFILNQLRIVVLFYVQRSAPDRFEFWHDLVLPVALTLATLAAFQWWLSLHGVEARAPLRDDRHAGA
jgi:exosortase/archaeosortase family protein